MRFLILSDIHANRQALDAVIADANGDYDLILCLGDVVGYGPDPNPVAEWVKANVPVTIRGNHDRACTGDPVVEWFSPPAHAAALWTLASLSPENHAYLTQLPSGPLAVEDFFLTHGSPRDEDEYITTRAEATQSFSHAPGDICFFGHSHVQGGFARRPGRTWPLGQPGPKDRERVLILEPDTSYLINPGSVGQPRDGDARAAYALYDSQSRVVTYRRTSYDVEKTQQRIRAAMLPTFLASRLAVGR